MTNNYMKRGALILGAFALLGTNAIAQDETVWHNINYKVSNPAWIPGWSGCLTDVQQGVGEVYNGAFNLYQVLPDMPAGDYTLTVNAFHRTSNAPKAYANFKEGFGSSAYIYINDSRQTVCSLFDRDDISDDVMLDADGNYTWAIVPNSLGVANHDFSEGRYLNTITVNHPGGDLTIGIANPGAEREEWVAFDNFKLTGPEGDMTDKIVNASFTLPMGQGEWDITNIQGSNKTPDLNKGGGVFRKSNASPYNIGQTLTDMPAGKYRFSVISFFRHGCGNTEGGYYPIKNAIIDEVYTWIEDQSAYDLHTAGLEDEVNHPFIYIYNNTDEDPYKEAVAEWIIESGMEYHETPIMCMFDAEPEYWVDNVPTPELAHLWVDSGFEYESSAMFVAHPEVYLNTVEITLNEPGNLTFGIKKDINAPRYYWNPWTDMKLEYAELAVGVDTVGIDNSNAPVEYYNLQGLRVAEPTDGIYIVKQGTEVRKQVIRK